MKFYLFISYILITNLAIGQTLSPYKQLGQSIHDDGKILDIKINGQRVNGEKVRYKQNFDVSALSVMQRDSLRIHILDSLGIKDTATKISVSPSTLPSGSQNVQFVCKTCSTKGNLEVYGNNFVSTRRIDGRNEARTFPISMQLAPGDYRLIYYRRKKSQSTQLLFTVKEDKKSIVTIN